MGHPERSRGIYSGDHILRFECLGRNPNTGSLLPPLHALAIDRIVLLRLEDVTGYMAATNQVLKERANN